MGKHHSDDPRNYLLLDFARLVRELAPTYFVLENVPGLLSDGAEPFRRSFIRRVRLAGYDVVEPIRALDASDYGIPQRRKRVFMLGWHKEVAGVEYPGATSDAGGVEVPRPPTVWDAIGDLPEVERHVALLKCGAYVGVLGEASEYAKLLRGDVVDPGDASASRASNGHVSGCMRTRHSREVVRRFEATGPGQFEAVSRFYRLSKEGIATTLRAGTGPKNGSFMAPASDPSCDAAMHYGARSGSVAFFSRWLLLP